MHWSERLNQRLDELGWKRPELAKRTGIDIENLNKWAQGGVDNPRGNAMRLMADAMGVTEGWLKLGQKPKFLDKSSTENLGLANANNPSLKSVPIIDLIGAGRLTEVIDPYEVGDGKTFELSDNEIGPRSFALRVVGYSMLPKFEDDDIIICDPDAAIRPGDFVIAKTANDEEATLKKYRPRGVDETGHEKFELVPLNEDYETLTSDSRTPYRIIARVARRIERF